MNPPGKIEEWVKANKKTELAPWVNQSELDTHIQVLKSGGFTGPLNWYKQSIAGVTHHSEAKLNSGYASKVFSTPTLFVGSEKDNICLPALQLVRMKDFFEDLTVKSLDSSHWIMLEKPTEVWEIVQAFIEEKGQAA